MIDNYKPTARDYPGDFSDENGNYEHDCFYCKQKFIGHKRRMICKECEDAQIKEMASRVTI